MDTTSYQQGELVATLLLLVVGYALFSSGRQRHQETGGRKGGPRRTAGIVLLALGAVTIVAGFLA